MEKSEQSNTAEAPPNRSGSPTPLAVCKEDSKTAKKKRSGKQVDASKKGERKNKGKSVKGGQDEDSLKMFLSKKRPRQDKTEMALVEEPKKKRRCYTFYTRMGPKMMRAFIESKPSENKIKAIESMGFGGLLKIQMDTVPVELAFWLATNFDPSSSSIKLSGGNTLQITDYDIHLATGIPNGRIQIREATTKETSKQFLDSKTEFSEQFGPAKLTTKHILTKLIEDKEAGEQFKRNFIVFAVNSLLGGIKGANPSYRILKCLGDMEAVKSFDWCAYTRRKLVEGVEMWKADRSDQPVFAGPIVVLVYIYLDRCMFRHTLVNRSIPTLESWTRDAITTRLDKEAETGYGKGGLQKPISKAPVVEDPCSAIVISQPTLESWTRDAITTRLDKESETGYGKGGLQKPISKAPVVEAPCSAIVISQPREEPVKEKIDSNTSFKKVGKAAIELASAFEHFFQALDESEYEDPNSDVIKLMASLAEKFVKGFEYSRKATGSEDGVKSETVSREKLVQTFREFASNKAFESEVDLFRALTKLAKAVGISPTVCSTTAGSPMRASSSMNEHVRDETFVIEDNPLEIVPLFDSYIDYNISESGEQNKMLEPDELPLKNANTEADEMMNIQDSNPISKGKDFTDVEDVEVENEQHVEHVEVESKTIEDVPLKLRETNAVPEGQAEDFPDVVHDVPVGIEEVKFPESEAEAEAQHCTEKENDTADDVVVEKEEVKITVSEEKQEAEECLAKGKDEVDEEEVVEKEEDKIPASEEETKLMEDSMEVEKDDVDEVVAEIEEAKDGVDEAALESVMKLDFINIVSAAQQQQGDESIQTVAQTTSQVFVTEQESPHFTTTPPHPHEASQL